MEEKRVQLGVNIGELSNQLVQVNNLVEQNYQKALQGQTAYNKLLEDTISLLQQQADFIGQLNISDKISGGGNTLSNTMSSSQGGEQSDGNKFIEDIVENLENIWEFISELGTPIPVEVKNAPLKVQIEGETSVGSGQNGTTTVGSDGGGASSSSGDGGSNAKKIYRCSSCCFPKRS